MRTHNDLTLRDESLFIIARNIVLVFLGISISISDWVLFQPLEIGFPVKVVMFYVRISTSVGMHHVETDEITLLNGGEEKEGRMNRVFFRLKKQKLLLGQKLELDII